MADKENNSSQVMGTVFDEWDIECLNMDKEAVEKLKSLPERRDEEIWDKI